MSYADCEEGSATVLGAFVVMAMAALIAASVCISTAVAARHVAQSAADLSALAGAVAKATGEHSACEAARQVAQLNHAQMLRCRIDGEDVVVAAGVRVRLGRLGVQVAVATARAGMDGYL